MNKFLFLDIDGVLNSSKFMETAEERWMKSPRENPLEKTFSFMFHQIDEIAIIILNDIIKKTGAKVVISSSWRVMHSFEDLKSLLAHKGLQGEIIGKTPDLFKQREWGKRVFRGEEIADWLQNNSEPGDRFIIIDDDSDAGFGFGKEFIPIKDGIRIEDAEEAILILNGGK